MTFGDRLNIVIRKNNIKKGSVAKDIGISATYLSDVLGGKYNPSPELMIKIKEYFSDDIEFLDSQEEFYKNINDIPKVMSHLTESMQNWILNKSNKPYLTLSKTLLENDLEDEQILLIVKSLKEQYKKEAGEN